MAVADGPELAAQHVFVVSKRDTPTARLEPRSCVAALVEQRRTSPTGRCDEAADTAAGLLPPPVTASPPPRLRRHDARRAATAARACTASAGLADDKSRAATIPAHQHRDDAVEATRRRPATAACARITSATAEATRRRYASLDCHTPLCSHHLAGRTVSSCSRS